MISDVVITKALPAFIKDSIEAYIGCVSGAMMRDEYLDCIKAAGFQGVKVIGETLFPFDCLINDPTAKAIIENEKITAEEAQEIARKIKSKGSGLQSEICIKEIEDLQTGASSNLLLPLTRDQEISKNMSSLVLRANCSHLKGQSVETSTAPLVRNNVITKQQCLVAVFPWHMADDSANDESGDKQRDARIPEDRHKCQKYQLYQHPEPPYLKKHREACMKISCQ